MYQNIIGFEKNVAILNHHQALLGTFFSSLIIQAEYLTVTSNVSEVLDWEYTLPFNGAVPSHQTNLYTNHHISTPHFVLKFKDAWLVRSLLSAKENPHSGLQLVEVKNASDMQIFLEGFSQAFFPFNHHQAMNYQDALFTSYQTGKSKLHFFYVLDDNQRLVAVSAIAMVKPYSFSYCIGVLSAFRGKKISRFLLDHHLSYAEKAGCQFQVLQTEHGSFVEDIYIKNHFSVFAVMNYYQHIPE